MQKRKYGLLGLLSLILVGTAVFAGDIEVKINGATDAFTIDKSDGNEAMRVTSSGNVGIGNSTPTRSLDILRDNYAGIKLDANNNGADPASTTIIELEGFEGRAKGIKITDEDSLNSWFIGEGYNYDGIGIGTDTLANSQEEYSANAKLFVGSNGNVGIGTTAPTSVFHVTENTANQMTTRIQNKGDGDAKLTISTKSGGTGDSYLTFNLPGQTNWHMGGDRADNGNFKIGKASTNISDVSTGNILTILRANNNVGIGTTNPTSSLQISESIYFNRGKGNVPDGSDIFMSAQGILAAGHNLFLHSAADGAAGDIYFSSGSDSRTGAINHMIVKNTGDVGIGTTTPNAKLEVSGGIKLANDAGTCDATKEGTQRYNSTSKDMEFCNGTDWKAYGSTSYAEQARNAARSICYSTFNGNVAKSIIMVPLPDNQADLDDVCHTSINGAWHANGIAKGNFWHQNCPADLNNSSFGGSYTSFLDEAYFEANRTRYPNCGATNSFVCCSTSFAN